MRGVINMDYRGRNIAVIINYVLFALKASEYKGERGIIANTDEAIIG